ncbi:hypothetical protein CEE69_12465 [Rhodopirellula bahusiensis]|uniref:Uncharacterized protein n=1 Tax=Rhodopirellula bahusiensis TaxID=2014065 RepID=A0A2G1W856_9BACT|nr:hypothetical protein CEE69_12465 [Rhodopirellula bahusiensis]
MGRLKEPETALSNRRCGQPHPNELLSNRGFLFHRSIRPGTNESDASPADAPGSFVDPAGT